MSQVCREERDWATPRRKFANGGDNTTRLLKMRVREKRRCDCIGLATAKQQHPTRGRQAIHALFV